MHGLESGIVVIHLLLVPSLAEDVRVLRMCSRCLNFLLTRGPLCSRLPMLTVALIDEIAVFVLRVGQPRGLSCGPLKH